jgi:hypothetical protein
MLAFKVVERMAKTVDLDEHERRFVEEFRVPVGVE